MGRLGDIEVRSAWLVRHVLPEEAGLRSRLRRLRYVDVDIDDIVQETYARLVQVGDVSLIQNVRAYIYRVAHSVIVDRMRRKTVVMFGTCSDVDALSALVEVRTPEDYVHGRNELRRLIDIVSELPDKTRDIFMLSRIQGLSIRAVSLQTGIPESTVEKHVARAMMHLMQRNADGGKSAGIPSKKARVFSSTKTRSQHSK